MRVDAFDFELPQDLIATHPVEPRDAARLLVVDPAGPARHHVFRDLSDLLEPGDLLVINDTRVIPARLLGRKGEGKVEVTLVSPQAEGRWKALARPVRKLTVGTRIEFAEGFSATVEAKRDMGELILRFETGALALVDQLDRHGAMPLPPYIKRSQGADTDDRHDYQTVYANEPGAVAAPTAGLHFTDALFDRLAARGIGTVRLTLHVGLGTFQPIRVEDTDDHVMHAEWGRIDETTAGRVNACRAGGGRVVAVGTTSVRLLESAADADGQLHPFEGQTDIFITPGYRFRIVDLMITNFHLPQSTLFMLVSAFAGTETMKAAYQQAIDERYRFYSYGDACLLENNR
ncbi:MAG: tRNA preQ1(34) S-adenosylmethionine ribosyltransferase-isomerase QueA [Rhodospirillaceae bacterium]|nr:tRNA preQ1(34) S-adenosylmethionine ribosyltransferase-isomerase QueA [Rhodospirillaceae bacterium]|tara:strand:- start:289 stop:1326 length:1038 start_codon:yes stop_codon:yes gene_type:complete